jgi:nicotinate-nucleotide adenylyltransferase
LVKNGKPVVALFGGSFDPPHLGHQRIVEEALKHLDIDLLLVVPTYLNPFKTSSLADAKERLKWCHTLFDEIPNVIVDAYEVEAGKSITTSQTLSHFKTRYDVKYLIIGSDNLSTLTKWHDFDRLNREVIWVIATRPGHPLETSMLREWKLLEIDEPVSSTQIREGMNLQHIDKKIEKSVKETLKGNKE